MFGIFVSLGFFWGGDGEEKWDLIEVIRAFQCSILSGIRAQDREKAAKPLIKVLILQECVTQPFLNSCACRNLGFLHFECFKAFGASLEILCSTFLMASYKAERATALSRLSDNIYLRLS